MDKKEKAIEIVKYCDNWGFATVATGVFLEKGVSLQEQAVSWHDDDPGKSIDFSACPYWITTDDGMLPIGITGADDPDLINAVEIFPFEIEKSSNASY